MLKQNLDQNQNLRKMLKRKLVETRAEVVTAEREFQKATSLAAGYFHDLELLRYQVLVEK